MEAPRVWALANGRSWPEAIPLFPYDQEVGSLPPSDGHVCWTWRGWIYDNPWVTLPVMKNSCGSRGIIKKMADGFGRLRAKLHSNELG